MQEQLISFEVAKLAKEKGFDWGVFSSYKVIDSCTYKINHHQEVIRSNGKSSYQWFDCSVDCS